MGRGCVVGYRERFAERVNDYGLRGMCVCVYLYAQTETKTRLWSAILWVHSFHYLTHKLNECSFWIACGASTMTMNYEFNRNCMLYHFRSL